MNDIVILIIFYFQSNAPKNSLFGLLILINIIIRKQALIQEKKIVWQPTFYQFSLLEVFPGIFFVLMCITYLLLMVNWLWITIITITNIQLT